MAKRNSAEPELPQRITPLSDYRSALDDLNTVAEKLATLQALHADQASQLTRAEADHEQALVKASQADELDEGHADELIRIATRMEVLRRKGLDTAHRLEAAERDRIALVRQTASRFSSLWRAFLWFSTEKEVERLKAGLAAPCDGNLLAVVAGCSHAVVAAKKLDIVLSDDASALVESAGKLLEAVEREPAFPVPAYAPAPVVPSLPEEEPFQMSGPWEDGKTDIRALVEELRREDPTLTLAGVNRALFARRPDLFRTREEVLAMNAPISQPETGVWEAEMIGSTTTQ